MSIRISIINLSGAPIGPCYWSTYATQKKGFFCDMRFLVIIVGGLMVLESFSLG